jgi:hypothetical protein
MRKLNLDQLSVESFETNTQPAARGTVRGNEWTEPFECGESDLVSCGGSCGYTNCGDHTCAHGCTGDASCGNSCNCPTRPITCQYTSPDPIGTCCGATC